MKYIDEFRDGELARGLTAAIAREAQPQRNYRLMEFCGGHTHAISRYGLADLLPPDAAAWAIRNIENAILINVLLAVFNMVPLPPLDGGRVAVGLLPDSLSRPLARLEPYGMPILLGLIFILPLIGNQLGVDLNVIGWVLSEPVGWLVDFVIRVTGNG